VSVAGPLEWSVFWSAVVALLGVDFFAARRGRVESVRTAAKWSTAWIALALAFGAWLWLRYGSDVGLAYLTAYTMEKSLSVDNLFVFTVLFAHTGIPPGLQRRALFWGVAGALAMRAVMIGLGVYLLAKFHWVIYPFAGLLAYSAVRMLRGEAPDREIAEATCSLCTSWVARFVPITPVLHGKRFLIRQNGRLTATPLLVALVALETADLVFAVDSIPAVLAVTRDPFLVYTSNVLALLGLRSLYFLLAGVIQGLRFLRVGLAVMLLFAAAKMLLSGVIEIPPGLSLALVAGIFLLAVVASRIFPPSRRGTYSQHRE
jgi:tellurite resistance protein TerC